MKSAQTSNRKRLNGGIFYVNQRYPARSVRQCSSCIKPRCSINGQPKIMAVAGVSAIPCQPWSGVVLVDSCSVNDASITIVAILWWKCCIWWVVNLSFMLFIGDFIVKNNNIIILIAYWFLPTQTALSARQKKRWYVKWMHEATFTILDCS